MNIGDRIEMRSRVGRENPWRTGVILRVDPSREEVCIAFDGPDRLLMDVPMDRVQPETVVITDHADTQVRVFFNSLCAIADALPGGLRDSQAFAKYKKEQQEYADERMTARTHPDVYTQNRAYLAMRLEAIDIIYYAAKLHAMKWEPYIRFGDFVYCVLSLCRENDVDVTLFHAIFMTKYAYRVAGTKNATSEAGAIMELLCAVSN